MSTEIKPFDTNEHATLIAKLAQSQVQYDNYSISLHAIKPDNDQWEGDPGLPAGSVVQVDDDGADSTYYLLGAPYAAVAIADPDAYLREQAQCWVDNSDEPIIEALRWGLTDVESLAVPEDHVGECRIIAEGYYNSHSPIGYVTDDNHEPIMFTTRAAAAEWIAEAESGVYQLAHNEAGRPTYTIVAA